MNKPLVIILKTVRDKLKKCSFSAAVSAIHFSDTSITSTILEFLRPGADCSTEGGSFELKLSLSYKKLV